MRFALLSLFLVSFFSFVRYVILSNFVVLFQYKISRSPQIASILNCKFQNCLGDIFAVVEISFIFEYSNNSKLSFFLISKHKSFYVFNPFLEASFFNFFVAFLFFYFFGVF